jgi:hypothetical protein
VACAGPSARPSARCTPSRCPSCARWSRDSAPTQQAVETEHFSCLASRAHFGEAS